MPLVSINYKTGKSCCSCINCWVGHICSIVRSSVFYTESSRCLESAAREVVGADTTAISKRYLKHAHEYAGSGRIWIMFNQIGLV